MQWGTTDKIQDYHLYFTLKSHSAQFRQSNFRRCDHL